jgi:hypothetical protein
LFGDSEETEHIPDVEELAAPGAEDIIQIDE